MGRHLFLRKDRILKKQLKNILTAILNTAEYKSGRKNGAKTHLTA